MTELTIITDYKDRFGSNSGEKIYRSGYDKELLKKHFQDNHFKIKFISFVDIIWEKSYWQNRFVLYQSHEEKKMINKSFIEDVILALELLGAKCIPNYYHLRSHENKVFMELIAKVKFPHHNVLSKVFGTLEEIYIFDKKNNIQYPIVVKSASGSKSRGVFLAKNKSELIKYCKKIQKTYSIFSEIKEYIRAFKHKNYKKESQYQNKIVLQSYIPNLKNDWKVLIYDNEYYVLNRGIKPNDFRASGSGFNYKSGSKGEIPFKVLDYCKNFFETFNVPNMSIDVAFDGEKCYIIEFQSISFGTSTIKLSDDYYAYTNDQWTVKKNDKDFEKIYVNSIVNYLKKNE